MKRRIRKRSTFHHHRGFARSRLPLRKDKYDQREREILRNTHAVGSELLRDIHFPSLCHTFHLKQKLRGKKINVNAGPAIQHGNPPKTMTEKEITRRRRRTSSFTVDAAPPPTCKLPPALLRSTVLYFHVRGGNSG